MKVIKYIVKTIAWVPTGTLLLVAIVLVAIQTPPVKRLIIQVAEKQINLLLNAELSVGKLSGNFFTNLQLNDILLLSESKDTIAFIPKLQLRYKLFPLLQNKIEVKQISIERPFVYIEQQSDSTWNLQHIVKTSTEEKTEVDTTPSTFNMLVQLGQLTLTSGQVKTKTFISQIPEQLQELNIDLSGVYSTNRQEAYLKELRFISINPSIELKELNLYAYGDEKSVTLDYLFLQTKLNQLNIKGKYDHSRTDNSHISVNTAPIFIDEFKDFIPADFTLIAKPTVDLDAELKEEHLSLNLKVKDKNQGVDLSLQSDHLIENLTDSLNNIDATYNLTLNIQHADLKYWLNDSSLNYIVDGSIIAKGKGLDPQTLKANVSGNLDNVLIAGNPIEELNLLINYNSGDIKGNISGSGKFGTIYISPDIQQIMGKNPLYNISLITQHLNVSPILGGDSSYMTDINLNAFVEGSGLTLGSIEANAQLELSQSVAMGITIDTLGANINFIDQNIIINSLLLNTLSAQLEASGNYSFNGISDLNINVDVENPKEITKLLAIEKLETNVHLNAHIHGKLDSLEGLLNLGVGTTQFQDVYLDSLSAIVSASMFNDSININGNVSANNLIAGGFELNNIQLQAETNTKDINLNLDIESSDIQTSLSSSVSLGDTIDITIPHLWLNYKGYTLETQEDTALIRIGKDEYEVRDFHLASVGILDSIQSLYLDGKISRTDSQDFKMEIVNLNLNDIAKVFVPNLNIVGILNMNLRLDGSADAPVLNTQVNVDTFSVQEYRFKGLNTNITYQDNQLGLGLDLDSPDSSEFHVAGRLPMEIRLDSMTFNVMPEESDSINLQLLIKQFPLAILNLILPTDETKGNIESNISLDGTIDNPNIHGDISITNGIVRLRTYGVNYEDIQIGVVFGEDKVYVDTFLIRSRTGNMSAEGEVKFESQFYKGELNSSELKILFNRFKPIDHRQYNIELTGNIGVAANKDSTAFSGDITIPSAMVYLPAVMKLMGKSSVSDIPQPLLAIELEKGTLSDSIVYTFQPDTSDTRISKLEFLNNLQGNIRVRIPRNTWIRNEDMRIELSGDVELMKHKEYFEIFGSVDVVRGQYNLFGKVFVIETGTITFQGGEKINPMLNIEATYSFRDNNRNKRDLAVIVTGEAFSPEIKFTLEGADISEGDALSYILFGTNMDALASGQQNDLNSSVSAGDLAEMVASSIISSQLTKLLGNTFNVDYIEFRSSSSFDNASFVVGKYITNKLFVSYEQNIGNIEDKDIARYEMTMEYELFKFLFLQLTSSPITNGFDVIFKINSK